MTTKRILVVDDSTTVRRQISDALVAAGYSVVEAADGRAGADALLADGDIALVIADVNMPRMNGLEMLEEMKSRPENKALPILMLTTEGQPSLMRRAKAAGAVGWIVKPFQPAQLVAVAQRLSR